MALEWKECYINIPLNDTGIEEHERFDVEMPNVFSVALSIACFSNYTMDVY